MKNTNLMADLWAKFEPHLDRKNPLDVVPHDVLRSMQKRLPKWPRYDIFLCHELLFKDLISERREVHNWVLDELHSSSISGFVYKTQLIRNSPAYSISSLVKTQRVGIIYANALRSLWIMKTLGYQVRSHFLQSLDFRIQKEIEETIPYF